MATWVCATCGPAPAGAIRHLDHNSPHGHETCECGSSAGLDWTTDRPPTSERNTDMSTETTTEQDSGVPSLHGDACTCTKCEKWAEIEAWMCPRCLGNCVCADLDYAPRPDRQHLTPTNPRREETP